MLTFPLLPRSRCLTLLLAALAWRAWALRHASWHWAACLATPMCGRWAATWWPPAAMALMRLCASTWRRSWLSQVTARCVWCLQQQLGGMGGEPLVPVTGSDCPNNDLHWGRGCTCTPACHTQPAHTRSATSPPTTWPCLGAGGGQVFDYRLVAGKGGGQPPELRPWSEAVPVFSYHKDVPFFQACACGCSC